MRALHTYLPQDRLRALARGTTLPDRCTGTALFVDISGFTPLTERLTRALGARRGAEELAKQLEVVYSALIAEIERHGGSVIDFAGDSMLCWFDAACVLHQPELSSRLDPATLATACGLALQQAMRAFAELALPDHATTALTIKVSIASGTARRFTVGNPELRVLDVLAGDTITRTAIGERLTHKGEVLIDQATTHALGETAILAEWREDAETHERFAVLSGMTSTTTLPLVAPEALNDLPDETLHHWLHRAQIERAESGQSAFFTEFRPCVVLFMRFIGIQYDAAEAGAQLDHFIRSVQDIADTYDGTLLHIIIGDKGSYAYLNFGIFKTHEDDARRALKAAEALREAKDRPFLQSVQIGLTQGPLRTGAYGSQTRKTLSALGDEVNLAARLMTSAAPGEILVSSHVHKAVETQFVFEPRPPLPLKGKAEPLSVFAVTGARRQRAIKLQEPEYALPMVGRAQELALINAQLAKTLEGQAQVIGIVAEAGVGKSRLVAEVIRSARKQGFVGFGGACQSDGIHTPYLAWKSIWQAFFDVDPSAPLRKQMRLLEREIEDRAPGRVEAMPLLNVVLDLSIPDNDFTKHLEPKIRQSALHVLLEDCLKTQAQDEPTLIVIQDLHWIDAVSHDLLEQLAQALAQYRVCFVLAYRPPQITRLVAPRLEGLPQFTRIALRELDQAEAEQVIRAKLRQLYPARSGGLPSGLVDTLMARAQGNPFYLEELLNYVHDRGLDPSQVEKIELPDSLHVLILSRIDQLNDREQTTLRVASIIGRLFRAKWLTGCYPELGSVAQVKAALDELDRLDITPLNSELEWSYLFKHIVTHEVTYESLSFATRARLHEQLARYLEGMGAATALPLDTIAFHYGRSENRTKQREYLRKAGEAAQQNFASEAALEYYGALLPLLKDTDAKATTQIHLQRGQVWELKGQWAEAESDYRAALETANGDTALQASAQFALGKLYRLRGNYELALEWLAQAKATRTQLADTVGLAQVLIETGMVWGRKGEYTRAREPLQEGLVLARAADDKLHTAQALHTVGTVAWSQGDYPAARALFEESLALRRALGNKPGIALSLNNLGSVAWSQGDYPAARALYKDSLALQRALGDKWGTAVSLNNLGTMALYQGDYPAARALHEESLALRRALGDKWGIALSLNNLGCVANSQGDYPAARVLHEEGLALRRAMGDKSGIAVSLNNLGNAVDSQGDYPAAQALYEESLTLRREIGDKRGIVMSYFDLGHVALEQRAYTSARAWHAQSLMLAREIGDKQVVAYNLASLASVALALGDSARAARLAVATEAHLTAIQGALDPYVRRQFDHTLAALGEAALKTASPLTLDEAIAFALEDEAGETA